MTKLKVTEKTILAVKDSDVDRLAMEMYGFDPRIAAAEEWFNDTVHEFVVDGKLDKWDERVLAKFKEDGTTTRGIAHVLLDAFAADGLAEPGRYVVDASW